MKSCLDTQRARTTLVMAKGNEATHLHMQVSTQGRNPKVTGREFSHSSAPGLEHQGLGGKTPTMKAAHRSWWQGTQCPLSCFHVYNWFHTFEQGMHKMEPPAWFQFPKCWLKQNLSLAAWSSFRTSARPENPWEAGVSPEFICHTEGCPVLVPVVDY